MSARSRPAPVAAPLIAAITGLSSASIASGTLCTCSSSSRLRSSGVRSPRFLISPMSPPLQKALPAPVMITTETASFVRHSVNAAAQASSISQVKAFMRSGRLSVIVAIPPSISNLRLSVMVVSSSRARDRHHRPPRAACEQAPDQHEVRDIEGDAEREGRLVISEPVIERATHPGAERHAQEAEQQHGPDPPAGLAPGKQIAHGKHIAWDEAAEPDPECRRYRIEPVEIVDEEIAGEEHGLRDGPDQDGLEAADAVGHAAPDHSTQERGHEQ